MAEHEPFGDARRSVALIVNTHARRGRKAFGEAKRLMLAAGFAVEAHAIDDPDNLGPTVEKAVADGHKLVVLGGGDGTISSAVGAFAGADAVLGLLPLGTANSFARSLGIPLDLPGAIDVLAKGEVAAIDMGRVGDRHFTNVLSIGLQTAIARSVSPALKRVLGRGSYAVAALVRIGRFHPFRVRILPADAPPREIDAALEVRIANGPYKGGLLAAPEADLASGDLVVHVVKGRSSLTLGRAWARLLTGSQPDDAILERVRAPSLRLETDPPQDVSIDGEVAARTPIEVSVLPGALKVMRGRKPT